jgi:cysteine synthase B
MRTNYLKNEGIALKVLVKSKIDSTEFTDITVNSLSATDDFSILNKIGNTPIIKKRILPKDISPYVSIYAKAEWLNPGNRIKDRAKLKMILEGDRNGILNHNKIILDATSGNTGIAYTLIAAVIGYKFLQKKWWFIVIWEGEVLKR